MTDPLDLAAIDRMTPDEYAAFIIRLAQEMPADVVQEERRRQLRTIAAAGDKLENFLAFYELVHGSDMVKHNLEALTLEIEAFERGVVFLWLGFRGCRKTSTQYTLAAFLHGHHPDQTGMITGANDSNAKLIAKSVAQINEYHPEFKAVFPNIVIDKDRGWGAEGYWVRDASRAVRKPFLFFHEQRLSRVVRKGCSIAENMRLLGVSRPRTRATGPTPAALTRSLIG